MELLIETFKDFFGMVEGKFVVATVIMSIITLLVIYLIFLITTSFRKRRDALNIKLPDINENGQVIEKEARFKGNKEITVELIDTNEDGAFHSDVKTDEKVFLTTLTVETREFIPDDETVTSKLNMPEVGEIDYEQIKEEKRKEKEQEFTNHLRKVAQADNEEDLVRVDNLV